LLVPHPAKRPMASAALESTWLTTSKHLPSLRCLSKFIF
jgi:hypothetical protein